MRSQCSTDRRRAVDRRSLKPNPDAFEPANSAEALEYQDLMVETRDRRRLGQILPADCRARADELHQVLTRRRLGVGPRAFLVELNAIAGLEHRGVLGGSTVWIDPDKRFDHFGQLVLVDVGAGAMSLQPLTERTAAWQILGTAAWVERPAYRVDIEDSIRVERTC